jgi:tetratricopeptide (TPR) repeat protein
LDESAGNFGMIAKAQMDLCGLLRQVGRMDEAWQFACAATISARRAEIFPVLVMALEREAFCALDRGDLVKALAAASEAVQVIKPGKVHDGMRARALTTRARCLLAHGNLSEAELDLDSSWELLQARSGLQMLPGPIFTLANWWEVKSQLEATQGNLASAREAITRAIGYGRQLNGPHALLGLARALEKLGEISRMDGDWSAEERATREARSIREELHLPCSA